MYEIPNAKFCPYTGCSISLMQKYLLAPAYHLLWILSEDVTYQYLAT